MRNIDQEGKEKLRNIQNEKEYLTGLNREIEKQMRGKKTHLNLVKNYTSAIIEINQ